jgi:hypothetical protein
MNTFPILERRPGIGAFDVCYHTLNADVPKEQLDFMIMWLSNQCQKNFIMTAVGMEVVAGGWVDNKRAWEIGSTN